MSDHITSAMRGVPVVLQDAQTAGSGLVIAIPDSFKHHKLYIKGIPTVSAGAVQPESSSDPTYAGTWGEVGGGSITVIDATEQQIDFEGVFKFLRVRISTNIVGGTVTVTYVGS